MDGGRVNRQIALLLNPPSANSRKEMEWAAKSAKKEMTRAAKSAKSACCTGGESSGSEDRTE